MGLGESKSGRVFASTLSSHTYYTDDGGLSWKPSYNLYSVAYDFAYKGDTVFAGSSYGVFISVDDGLTWQFLLGLSGSVRRLLVAQNGDLIAGVLNNGVFQSKDNGHTWDPLIKGMSNMNVLDITFDITYGLYAVTDSGVYFTNYYTKGANSGVEILSYNKIFPIHSTHQQIYCLIFQLVEWFH